MLSSQTAQKLTFSISQFIGCTLLVAGTTIGAGMLGMPLITAKAGFFAATAITSAVWIFMLITGLLLLEVCLKVPGANNILSLSEHFLGKKGKGLIGSLFAFLYYCLLVAYFAAGSMLVSSIFSISFGLSLLLFAGVFGAIVALGARWIDKVNTVLTIAMFASYGLLIALGAPFIDVNKLSYNNISASLLATPVLFSAFGYHNIIPSLAGYVGQSKKNMLRLSVFLGTFIAFVIFLLWQWMIIGTIPQDVLQSTLSKGMPVTQALQAATGCSMIYQIGQYFAFFALTTSLLGVCFSMVDFLAGALKKYQNFSKRIYLTALTFLPPVTCVLWNPKLFDKALGLAGGVGEAFLNGFVPIVFYAMIEKTNSFQSFSLIKKIALSILSAFCFMVFLIEVKEILILLN